MKGQCDRRMLCLVLICARLTVDWEVISQEPQPSQWTLAAMFSWPFFNRIYEAHGLFMLTRKVGSVLTSLESD